MNRLYTYSNVLVHEVLLHTLLHIFYSIGEWISGSVCMYLAHYLVRNANTQVQ